MNLTLKRLGLLAILPLFTISVLVRYEYASAQELACPQGEVTLVRASDPNPICIKESTANRWVQLGIATIVGTVQVTSAEPIPMETPQETMEEEIAPGSVLRLSRANVPATIPLHQGFYNGDSVYFIVTDSSDQTHADIVTEQQGWKVELAPLLANAPDAALSPVYIFKNGVEGSGVHGFHTPHTMRERERHPQ